MSTTLERTETELPTIIEEELTPGEILSDSMKAEVAELPEAFFVESTVSYSTLEDYLARGLISQEQIDNARAQVTEKRPTEREGVESYARNLMARYGIPEHVIANIINANRDASNEALVEDASRWVRRCDCTGFRGDFIRRPRP